MTYLIEFELNQPSSTSSPSIINVANMKAATLENNSDANYRGISTAFGSSPVSLTSINHVKRRSGQYDQVKLSREKQLLQQVKII